MLALKWGKWDEAYVCMPPVKDGLSGWGGGWRCQHRISQCLALLEQLRLQTQQHLHSTGHKIFIITGLLYEVLLVITFFLRLCFRAGLPLYKSSCIDLGPQIKSFQENLDGSLCWGSQIGIQKMTKTKFTTHSCPITWMSVKRHLKEAAYSPSITSQYHFGCAHFSMPGYIRKAVKALLSTCLCQRGN